MSHEAIPPTAAKLDTVSCIGLHLPHGKDSTACSGLSACTFNRDGVLITASLASSRVCWLLGELRVGNAAGATETD